MQPEAYNTDYPDWQTQIIHRLATVTEHSWCFSLFKLHAYLHIPPYGGCHHLKMAAAALDGYCYGNWPSLKVWLPWWSMAGRNVPWAEHRGVIKPITVSILYSFLHSRETNFSLVCSLWGEHEAVCVCLCVGKLDVLCLYAFENTDCVEEETVRMRDTQRVKICYEYGYWCIIHNKSLWLKHEKGKLSIN